MDIASLDQLLYRTPVIAQGLHPVSLAYLQEPVTIYSSLKQLAHLFDDMRMVLPHRAICFETESRYMSRFASVTVEHNPFTSELNRVLFDRYDFISSSMFTHDKVAELIITEARRVKTVILILLDGLSYSDCIDWSDVEPCLATHPTITRVGFPSIIGKPPLAAHLFDIGFTNRIGFTYWSRKDNKLTDKLFRTIAHTHRLDSAKPNAFEQVLMWLSAKDLTNTYVQIVHSALDDFAEGHRTAVPRRAVVRQVQQDLEAVLDVLKNKGLPAILFAVADHGILWKDDGHDIQRVNLAGARYTTGRSGPGRGRSFEAEHSQYWVLDYPQMGRAWGNNEQGIHGGISFEESIVPFVKWEVNH